MFLKQGKDNSVKYDQQQDLSLCSIKVRDACSLKVEGGEGETVPPFLLDTIQLQRGEQGEGQRVSMH